MSFKVRVWDLPTRVFHWLLAVCVIGLGITGMTGGDLMVWHFRFGYTVFALLLFRLVWGLIGGHWSRFRSFLYAPRSLLDYLRGRAHPDHLIGHSPLGAGSVFAMLLFLCVQVATGLMSDDEIAFSGPLSRFVSGSTVGLATKYHVVFGKTILIVLVVLHLAAVLFYLWRKRQNLIKPMLSGDKVVAAPATSSRDDARTRVIALVVLAGCVALVGWVRSLGGS